MSALQQKLRAYIVENLLFGQDGNFEDTDSFMESGIIDSTGVLELISYLEEEYSIVVEEEEMVPDNLDSVARLAEFVSRKRAKAGAVSPASGQ